MAQSDLARLLQLDGDLRLDFLDAPALRGNALGDPATRPLAVYLPPGYDAGGSRRYPVLYVLHGYTGSVAGVVAGDPWKTNVVQWADRLLRERRMPEALVAVVDGWNRYGGSQYVDSIGSGDYATYTVRDVVGHVDATYRTIPSDGGRAVLGKSSGGFGALHLTMAHPGVFGAMASHSGDANFIQASLPAFASAQRTLERHAGDVGAFVRAFEATNKPSQSEFQTIEMLGYAAAYSPRSGEPYDLDLPWDWATGALDERVFSRWRAYDPVERCRAHVAEFARLRLCYIDCGRRDEYALDVGARMLVARLREAGVAVRHEEFDDDHRNVGYRHAVSLPALVTALESAR